jgi:hypothetical protein
VPNSFFKLMQASQKATAWAGPMARVAGKNPDPALEAMRPAVRSANYNKVVDSIHGGFKAAAPNLSPRLQERLVGGAMMQNPSAMRGAMSEMARSPHLKTMEMMVKTHSTTLRRAAAVQDGRAAGRVPAKTRNAEAQAKKRKVAAEAAAYKHDRRIKVGIGGVAAAGAAGAAGVGYHMVTRSDPRSGKTSTFKRQNPDPK